MTTVLIPTKIWVKIKNDKLNCREIYVLLFLLTSPIIPFIKVGRKSLISFELGEEYLDALPGLESKGYLLLQDDYFYMIEGRPPNVNYPDHIYRLIVDEIETIPEEVMDKFDERCAEWKNSTETEYSMEEVFKEPKVNKSIADEIVDALTRINMVEVPTYDDNVNKKIRFWRR